MTTDEDSNSVTPEERRQGRRKAFTEDTRNVSITLRGFFIATVVAYATIGASDDKNIGHINLFLIFVLTYFFLDFFHLASGFLQSNYLLKRLGSRQPDFFPSIQLSLFIIKLVIFPIGFTFLWVIIIRAL